MFQEKCWKKMRKQAWSWVTSTNMTLKNQWSEDEISFWVSAYFEGRALVSGSVTNQQTSHVLLFSSIEVVERIYFLVSV